MRSPGALLLSSAGFAVAHTAGVPTRSPLLRFAEVAALALLTAYGFLATRDRAAVLRWSLLAGLLVLTADALTTVPPQPAEASGSAFTAHLALPPAEPAPLPMVLSAAGGALRTGGPVLLCAALLAVAVGALPATARRVSPRVVALLAGGALLTVTAYAALEVWIRAPAVREVLRGEAGAPTAWVELIVLAAPPLWLAGTGIAVVAIAAHRGARLAVAGGMLLVAATFPLVGDLLRTAQASYRGPAEHSVAVVTAVRMSSTPFEHPGAAFAAAAQFAAVALVVAAVAGATAPPRPR